MIAILQFPGTNCEKDMQHVYRDLLSQEVGMIWHKETSLPSNTKLVVIPGGFSYGDYLRSGAIARFAPIMKGVVRYANHGGLVLGICNGFQILTEAKLLPGVLKRNHHLNFVSKQQELILSNTNNKFLQNYQKNTSITLPIAHADGNYFTDEKTLEGLRENEQILLTYKDNPNGSVENIAGICNKEKNIFGLMPHPERASELLLGNDAGLKMLRNLCSC
ncbi:phosphoribosylformylglycinamidine synthase subunit PurQ [Helicobacter mustelae]|uniref:Phosphoribosylformylglycinamidine synthase subunit PurQ n=1 Tax=Helicobacter mustelae (strain ATCC 43772 / CCUG 25715 / CIP 103759 / LMG 18044 / NCTC 12198 / R85-136P) TaxID=679897 RepID=D3UI74_HELM1|nr:phosphoribosylformylglycinamidine synthase subunit PurQ [Helicobacter mustelae]CBG40197.1 phosphoribosylformylglycinamidine synthase I [Helicobacter mustelae 12198]SQH71699.1 phosphoribosylformylglycinamidine synthase I [Helicobacter mustelae]STP12825.1 phosphoribosylformylglycinamidine synthase I [Helicobacter mustelae]